MKKPDSCEFEKYQSEVREKWGGTETYREYGEKSQNNSSEQLQNAVDGLNEIFREFALCMKNGHTPDSSDAQALTRKLQNHITANFYTCTKQILAGLGQMYVADPRFRANIDQHEPGTAEFAGAAIRAYCTEE